MYEEHDTDARTHATDLNGVGDTDTEFRRGFWDFTILFYYHEEIIHPPSSDILAYLLLQPAGARAATSFGNDTLCAGSPSFLGIALDNLQPLGRCLWRDHTRQASALLPVFAIPAARTTRPGLVTRPRSARPLACLRTRVS